jgi:hypothetical protein
MFNIGSENISMPLSENANGTSQTTKDQAKKYRYSTAHLFVIAIKLRCYSMKY